MIKFTVTALALAERHLGLSIAEIVREAQSQDGLSLTTLTALAAARRYKAFTGFPLETQIFQFDQALSRAGEEIDERGTAAVAGEVGESLGAFVRDVMADR